MFRSRFGTAPFDWLNDAPAQQRQRHRAVFIKSAATVIVWVSHLFYFFFNGEKVSVGWFVKALTTRLFRKRDKNRALVDGSA